MKPDKLRQILEHEDASFYAVVLILTLATFASLFAGFFALAYVLLIVLTIYLVAVAQMEWKKRGEKWR